MRSRFARGAARQIDRIGTARSLDPFGYELETLLARPAQLAGRPAAPIAAALHGTPFGHPVHPMLVTLPIGTWTLALALDLLAMAGLARGAATRRAADTALRAGAAGAVVAAAAGLADWQHTNGRDRRIGMVHGAVNSVALGLTLVSLRLRRRGRRPAGQAASLAGWVCMAVGGYLGGHLVYRRRVGTDRADRTPAAPDWHRVLPLADLGEDRPRRVEVPGDRGERIGVALVRHAGRVHALGARCSHQGGPLDEGWMLGDTLVCPWHGSRYALDGQPMHGPSTCPQPRYAVRIRDGHVELRGEADPVRPAAGVPQGAPDAGGDSAVAVLTRHHDLFRQLFAAILATPREDPQRRDVLRTLAIELDIHEWVEDHIFYPAVQAVSPDVDIAHSEHRQLTDLLAMTLKLNTASDAFEAHLRALHQAVEHHAGSEERSMFRHAERLGAGRLRALGRDIEQRIETLRTARFQRGFLDLKVRLLEAARSAN